MKSFAIVLLFLFLAGCGGSNTTPQHIDIPTNADIKASLEFKDVSGARQAHVVFMYTTSVAPGSKELAKPTIIEVEDPRLDGEPLTTNADTGPSVYISGTAKQTQSSTISARINGKVYEGKTIPGAAIQNKQSVTTLAPK